jgi:hypothetical protein
MVLGEEVRGEREGRWWWCGGERRELERGRQRLDPRHETRVYDKDWGHRGNPQVGHRYSYPGLHPTMGGTLVETVSIKTLSDQIPCQNTEYV